MNENQTTIIVLPPGYTIKEELKARGIRQKDFAFQLGMQASHLSEIIKGTRAINTQMAEKLEEKLGIPMMFWLKEQSRYECSLKELETLSAEEQNAERLYSEYDKFCDMKTIFRRVAGTFHSCKERLDFCLTEMGFTTPTEMQFQYANCTFGRYHKSEKTGLDKRMINTWSILAKYEVKDITVDGLFDKNQSMSLAKELCIILHRNVDTEDNVAKTLSKYGIKFKVVPKVERASIDGYTFYGEDGIPAIVVTKRIPRIDNFAFAILHEVGHLALHNVEDFPILSLSDDAEDYCEDEANNFAAEALIPSNIWNSAPEVPMNQYTIQNRYTKWAEDNNMNKWIVLGRISHETGMYKFKSDATRKIQ